MRGNVVREPAVAGAFYPADPVVLRRAIKTMLEAARPELPARLPFAIVVPHAGYVYSGPVAATAYALVRASGRPIRSVAVFGPSHFVPLQGLAVSGASTWSTPLGDVLVHDGLRETAIAAGVVVDDEPLELEHALEVQLPWLQVIADPRCRILPVAVGWEEPEVIASVIATLGDRADLVVVSIDLSHYLPIEVARHRDRSTVNAVLDRDAGRISGDDACGAVALRGLVHLARDRDLSVRLLDLRTSGDTAGNPDRVVGYGAFAVGER